VSKSTKNAGEQVVASPARVDRAIEPVISDGRLPSAVSHPSAVIHQPIRRRLSLVWLLVGLAVLVGAVVFGLSLVRDPAGTEEVAAAPPETSEIQVRDLAETQDYTAQLQYDDALPVSATDSGYLTGLADQGSVLERGDVVYSLSNDPSKAQMLTAQQQVSSAESQLATANEQRSEVTAGPSASELSSAQAAVAQAQLSLERLTEPATEVELAAAQAQLAQAQEAYVDLLNGPSSSESASLQGEVTRAQQSYDQAVAARDIAWIALLSAQAMYCGLDPVPVSDLCASSDLPLSDADVANLTAAVQNSLAEGDNATVSVIQSFISASSSYENAIASVSSASTSLSTAQANLSEGSAAPSQATIDQALAAIYQAEEGLRVLIEGPAALEVTQAEASLRAAQARLDELLEGATAAQRKQAAAAVENAKIALELSQLELSQLVAEPTFVTIFYGDAASWRTLSLGSSPGSDIRQLEENLAALGYDPESAIVIDDVFDEATEQAVMRWQESLGTTVDGSVAASDILYTLGPVKAGSPTAGIKLGNAISAGASLIELVPVSRVSLDSTVNEAEESTQQIVVSMPVDDRDLVEEGSEVVVELADGTEVDAVVASIGSPVTGDSGSTVEVVVVPVEPIDDSWTGTNVSVVVTTQLVQQVLAVPVSALVALVEGGYAVEVLEADGSTQLIAVETGMFADGLVEISSGGLSEGMNVVVPG
jgi:multidrug efflux pump subunit AcrA (membrane-fusion protein)